MLITVNGAAREMADGAVLAALLPPDRKGTAVALNDEVVPREQLPARTLVEGDRVEIVTAVQGG